MGYPVFENLAGSVFESDNPLAGCFVFESRTGLGTVPNCKALLFTVEIPVKCDTHAHTHRGIPEQGSDNVLSGSILEAPEMVEYPLCPFRFESVVSDVFSVVKGRKNNLVVYVLFHAVNRLTEANEGPQRG